MSSFKNVTDVDLEVQVDGIRYLAKAGEEISVPDEFDSQFKHQPAWGGEEFAPAALPVDEVPEEVTPDKKTTKASAATEEKN